MHTVTSTTPRSGQTAMESHGPFVVVRHQFTLARDTFYTVRDTRTGRDLSHSYRLLRNARRVAKAQAALPILPPDCRNCGGDGFTVDSPRCPACHR